MQSCLHRLTVKQKETGRLAERQRQRNRDRQKSRETETDRERHRDRQRDWNNVCASCKPAEKRPDQQLADQETIFHLQPHTSRSRPVIPSDPAIYTARQRGFHGRSGEHHSINNDNDSGPLVRLHCNGPKRFIYSSARARAAPPPTPHTHVCD